jgi:hypothetical protein
VRLGVERLVGGGAGQARKAEAFGQLGFCFARGTRLVGAIVTTVRVTTVRAIGFVRTDVAVEGPH